jgi:hypothetical protein
MELSGWRKADCMLGSRVRNFKRSKFRSMSGGIFRRVSDHAARASDFNAFFARGKEFEQLCESAVIANRRLSVGLDRPGTGRFRSAWFTDPEFSRVRLSETQSKSREIACGRAKLPVAAVLSARTLSDEGIKCSSIRRATASWVLPPWRRSWRFDCPGADRNDREPPLSRFATRSLSIRPCPKDWSFFSRQFPPDAVHVLRPRSGQFVDLARRGIARNTLNHFSAIHREFRIRLQKSRRWKLGSLSAITSARPVPWVVSGRCFKPS